MSLKKLLIFPFNGNGIEALDCLDENSFEFLGFIDDDPEKKKHNQEWPIFGREVLNRLPEAYVLAVPGSPVSFPRRAEFIGSLNISRNRYISLIHPSAKMGRKVTVGLNCLIMAGVVITSNAKLGDHVCVLPNSVIHHDVEIGDYTMIGSNVAIAGGTIIGKNCYIGSGSNIINGIMIGEQSLIGLGSNVLRSVPERVTVAGNPAKIIHKP
jgi:sugar O-acyltransferase (sialic acid O-acetyltransferase NeuD family)